jgi:hypothetical protein
MCLKKYYRNIVFIIYLVLFIGFSSSAQVYVNLSKDEIKKRIKQDYPGYAPDKMSVNKAYKYLKYTNEAIDATLLIFLGTDDKCTYTKKMLAFSDMQSEIDLLNKKYKKAGQMVWVCRENDTDCTIKLTKEEWFFTVEIKRK